MNVQITKLKLVAIFLLLVSLLSVVSFNYALYFHFWLDDWMNLWFVLNNHASGYRGQFDYHPANYVIFFLQAFLFGTNPLVYNWFGVFCKIIVSLIVGLLAWQITRTKKAFYIATLLYASYFGGQESYVFVTARNNLVNLSVVCLTLVFYLQSKYRGSRKLFWLSLVFLYVSFVSDPGRMIFLPVLMIAYEFLRWIVKPEGGFKQTVLNCSLFLIVGVAGFLSTPLGLNPGGQMQDGHFTKVFLSISNYQAFFTGLGDLLGSYLHLFSPRPLAFSWVLGIFSLGGILLWSLSRIWKKQNLEIAVFSQSIWLFLLLNWLAFPYLISVSQHRYQTISAAFFMVLVTFFLLNMKKWLWPVVMLIILLHLIHSIAINYDWNTVRNYSKTQKLINTQLAFIPFDSKPQMLVIEGNPRIVAEGIGWTFGGTVPYSFTRNITRLEDLPSSAPTFQQNTEIFCNELGRRPVVADWIDQRQPMDISQVYGFKVNDLEQLENNTDEYRMRILGHAGCISKKTGSQISDKIKLDYYVVSSQLYTKNTTGVYLRWVINKQALNKLTIDYHSNNLNNKINETHFPVDLSKISASEFDHIIFISGNTIPQELGILVELCTKEDCQIKEIQIAL